MRGTDRIGYGFLKVFSAVVFALSMFSLTSCTRETGGIPTAQDIEPGTILIYGVVRDVFGNPVAGAKVKVVGVGTEVQTASDGTYSFKIVFDSLPADGVVTLRTEKEGFVPAYYSITTFAKTITSYTVSTTSVENSVVLQDRIKRADIVLYPPVNIKVKVIDEEGNSVPGTVVGALPGPAIAAYLGVSQNQFVGSVSSASDPVTFPKVVPQIIGDSVVFVAIPPEDKREDYDISVAGVLISDEDVNVVLVLSKQILRVLWTSVQSGQFIKPDDDIKVIFSKDVTGVVASLNCGIPPVNPIQLYAEIQGAVVNLRPAGRILGNCNLQITQAYGKNGELLDNGVISNAVFYTFIAFDPSAPRGLACPKPEVDLVAYSPSATDYRFDNIVGDNIRIFSRAIDDFNGYNETGNNTLNLVWTPPVVYGISDFKIYAVRKKDIVLGNHRWVDITPFPGPQFRITTGKWYASLNIGGLDLSYGDGVSIAVVPVNINGEELCALDNAQTLNVEDNLGPKIIGIGGWFSSFDYSERIENNVLIPFSEVITSASVEVTSRVFQVEKLSEEVLTPPNNDIVRVSFYMKPISIQIPGEIDPYKTENSNGDQILLIPKTDAARIWVGEQVFVRDSTGTVNIPRTVTAVVESGGNDVLVWFDFDVGITSTAINGRIVPRDNNPLQVFQRNDVQVKGDLIVNVNITGIAVGDTLQILDEKGNVVEVKVKGAGDLDGDGFRDDIQVDKSLSSLSCQDGTNLQCDVRSLTPDIWFKVRAWDTSTS